jgi:hypothetical protein
MRDLLDTASCDKVCQWSSPGTLVSPTNKIDHHNIPEIFLKLALKTLTLNPIVMEFVVRITTLNLEHGE